MKQKLIFFLYLAILILPNLILCLTELMPLAGKFSLVLLPLGIYWICLSLSPRLSRTMWWMFPVLFLGAFNIVLSYLFGRGVIAVDMWLNIATSSPDEMGEMLSQIYPAVVAVVVIYIPTLAYAAVDIGRRTELPRPFLRMQRRVGLAVFLLSMPFTFWAIRGGEWAMRKDLFPVNVCHNVRLAVVRQARSAQYLRRSADFTFEAVPLDSARPPKVLVLVIGETSRAINWQQAGYGRETTPLLTATPDITFFSDCMSQSNTTHKSVPILMSPATADNYDVLYHSKGLLAAFGEAGYHTVFISNEPRNKSFNDHLGEQAHESLFLRDKYSGTPMDSLLLPEVQRVLDRTPGNLLLVLHAYGSHSTYSDRYLPAQAHFRPDKVIKATRGNRHILINAYDNTIRYTDYILYNIIGQLRQLHRPSAMLYISDHGEDIYDDHRNLFLHASPWPSYYQLHVPLLVWTSEEYRREYPERVELMEARRDEPLQSDCVFPTMLGLGGISTPYGQDSLSLTSPRYETKRMRTYISDHNEPLPFSRCLEAEDFKAMEQRGLRLY
ncbi:MAG: phosphoethanolamine transferase [Bacteroides sp.]|nr:phosphoethanolamine transferase [Bacteroides sp.]MCM1447402.1 phosphoethanolamine transferase [Bacteroides sp.]